MIFNLGKIFIKYGLILLILLIVAVTIQLNLGQHHLIARAHSESIEYSDSTAVHPETAADYSYQDKGDFRSRANKEYHSALNSVNLIIYMINRVTNKSLR